MALLDPTGLGSIAEAAAKIISLFKSDPTIKAQIESSQREAELNAQLQQTLAQLEVNKAEASSPNWFVAGWRPFVGWICGIGLGYAIFGLPVAQTVMVFIHRTFDPTLLPKLDMGTIMGLLVPLLGIGAMRTVEKVNNSEGNRS